MKKFLCISSFVVLIYLVIRTFLAMNELQQSIMNLEMRADEVGRKVNKMVPVVDEVKESSDLIRKSFTEFR